MQLVLSARPGLANLLHDYLCERAHKPTLLLSHAVISVLKWDNLRSIGHRARHLPAEWGSRNFRGWNFLEIFTLIEWEIWLGGADMGQREKLTFVYDADGSIGVVIEFSGSDFEAYAMPDLALVGAFQTKALAAEALAVRSGQPIQDRCNPSNRWCES